MIRRLIYLLPILLFFAGCIDSTSTNNSASDDDAWLIDVNEVINGGPGKDGIPSIDSPLFKSAHETEYVQDERLIIGVKIDNEIKAYPHQMLDWHEIINDKSGDTYFSMTYCPLTGTGLAWDRTIDGEVTEFGVSGLLYRNNLVAYDRNTDSNWSQILKTSVHGPHYGKTLKLFQTVETTWSTWKKMYPESRILSVESGPRGSYQGYAYGSDYLTNHNDILFPIKNTDDRLPNKTIVHVITLTEDFGENSEIHAFPLNEMSDSIRVINEVYDENRLVIAGSAKYEFVVSFRRTLDDGTVLEFESIENKLPVIMQDQEGNEWNIFGEAVNGPRTGLTLDPTIAFNGYWFAIADFFPDVCIYPNKRCKQVIDK